jgi:dephospho-CoA kinase
MGFEDSRWILSGGMGSGKSIVRHLLSEAGMNTVDSDSIGHEVLEPGGEAFRQVAERWPDVVVDGRIDRPALGRIVFADPDALAELEGFTHPHIFGIIGHRVEGFGEGVVVVETPLIAEVLGSGWARMVVDSEDAARMERLQTRGFDQSDAQARMDAQPSRSEWLAVADLVIPNHGSLDDLRATVERVITRL